jgi:hypothetical protein
MSKYIARGNDITFAITFYDVDNVQSAPSSATLWVAYPVNGVETIEQLALVDDGNGVFLATWDSSQSDAGDVYWHARSSSPDKVARDGDFTLIANDANPDPV